MSNTQIDYGFYNFSAGKAPDEAYASHSVGSTLHCLIAGVASVPQWLNLTSRCPESKEVIGWYGSCMLRYSDKDIFEVLDQGVSTYLKNTNNVSDISQFCQTLGNLLGSLKSKASAGGSSQKFATGEASVSVFLQVYGLVQCTLDLSQVDCFSCIGQMINEIPECCHGSQGGRILQPSCYLRYEADKFYDSASSPTSPPTGKSSKKTKVVAIAIVVGRTLLMFFVTLIICCCLRRRRGKGMIRLGSKPNYATPLRHDATLLHAVSVDDSKISNAEALQFDFETIRAAGCKGTSLCLTNLVKVDLMQLTRVNFSKAKK